MELEYILPYSLDKARRGFEYMQPKALQHLQDESPHADVALVDGFEGGGSHYASYRYDFQLVVPWLFRRMVPEDSFCLVEDRWTDFPYERTHIKDTYGWLDIKTNQTCEVEEVSSVFDSTVTTQCRVRYKVKVKSYVPLFSSFVVAKVEQYLLGRFETFFKTMMRQEHEWDV